MDHETLKNRVLRIRNSRDGKIQTGGSGFFVRDDGIIATAAHVVVSEDYPLIGLFQDKELQLRVIRRFASCPEDRDFILLEVVDKPDDLIFETFSISKTADVGDQAFILGFPVNHGVQAEHPVFRTGRVVQEIAIRGVSSGYLAYSLDFQAPGGFSGSPVFSPNTGEVFGVFTADQKLVNGQSVAVMIFHDDFEGILKGK